MDFDNPLQKQLPWRWQEGDLTVTRSNAWSGPGCHEGCGVLIYTDKEGKMVKVEGDPENPFNQGRLCVRCLALPEVTYHPDRLLYPQKRVGERGEDKWERVSWEEAYDTIVTKFNAYKAEFGPQSVVFNQGTGRDVTWANGRLCYGFGSPNSSDFQSGMACYLPRLSSLYATTGSFLVADCSQHFPDRYDEPSWTRPECIVIWGCNPIISNADGFLGHWIVDCMKLGSKLIVIDPRLTWLAAKADIWLQIRPGTDAAMALAWLDVIINEKLYDEDFVEMWTLGFDELAGRVAEYPVEKMAEITWVPQEKIEAAARLYATSKPAAIQWGLAIDMTKESLPAGQAITALWSITGNVDIPGGMVTVALPYGADIWGGDWGYSHLSPEAKAVRIGLDKYPLLQWGLPLAQADEIVEAMLTDDPYPIKAIWLVGSNALACMGADPEKLMKALNRMEFVVNIDLFKTPTAVACADLLLPVLTYPEKNGLRAVWYHIGNINKAIEPVGEGKSDAQLAIELGHIFNPDLVPWETVEEYFDAVLEGTEMTFEEMRDAGAVLYTDFEYKKYEKGYERGDGELGFNTPSGRIELYSTAYERSGLDPLPYFEEPTESPFSTPEMYEEYPIVLTSGARHWASFHSEHRQIHRLRAMRPDPIVEIHPETAAKYGVGEGDWIWIENHRGRVQRKVQLTTILDPRVINADHGWWYPEKEPAAPSLYGMWDVNFNKLIPWDPGRSGFGANYKSLLCKIYKVNQGEEAQSWLP
ncbi:MAG: molybdopterin-dependent oxidoreductase [Coriobacteriia bacterium]|nr:molybdopterin-dependent oxidoreductase [Coriobacteriia bacterium]